MSYGKVEKLVKQIHDMALNGHPEMVLHATRQLVELVMKETLETLKSCPACESKKQMELQWVCERCGHRECPE